MSVILVLFAEDAGLTEEIDGLTYRPPAVDSSGHVQADVLSTTWPSFPTTVASGQETVAAAGTAVQLADQACKSVSIKALVGNTGTIYVGAADVSSAEGYELSPGEPVDLAISNVNKLYVDAATSGDGVSWLAVN